MDPFSYREVDSSSLSGRAIFFQFFVGPVLAQCWLRTGMMWGSLDAQAAKVEGGCFAYVLGRRARWRDWE
jgi:hypothetical protein